MGRALEWAQTVRKELRRSKSEEAAEEAELSEEFKGELSRFQNALPVVAAGAGLFSDGYVNNSVGVVNTCLRLIYGTRYSNSAAASNISSIAFAGTVVGQLTFGYVADYYSREFGMIVSTIILIAFTILSSVAWGAHGSAEGLFTALTIYRVFLGVGIGGEYPAGSVACAEASMVMSRGHRNRWFILFTASMIDFGCVISAVVPYALLCAFGTNRLGHVWRWTLALGAVPPVLLFFLRLKMRENPRFKKYNMRHTKFPYHLILKFYWFRLLVASAIWFIYDFSAYAFGIYFTEILNLLIPDGDLHQTFAWNILLNFFYLPGSLLGCIVSDYLGPRMTLVSGAVLQAIVGFVMAACLGSLRTNIPAFVIVYGLFMTLGEFGPGDHVGLVAAKTCATAIRGHYYGIAAAVGKIGAYIGAKVFPLIIAHYGEGTLKANQTPFYIAAPLCLFMAVLALVCLPEMTQDSAAKEDERFMAYLKANGFDTSKMGDAGQAADTRASSAARDVEYEASLVTSQAE